MDVMSSGIALRTILSKRQHFEGVLGDPILNAAGLHLGRMLASDATLGLRRRQVARHTRTEDERAFLRDGVVALPDFLSASEFDAVRAEVRASVERAATASPRPAESDEIGFGRKRPIVGGFDRFDGNTLNRFLELDRAHTPATLAALRSPRLHSLAEFASGFRFDASRVAIYETVNGDDAANPDIQRALHRDTFHSAIKVWLFLEDVAPEDGPFGYVVGSHRLDRARLRWEHRRARAASAPDGERDGAFRASDDDLRAMGLPPPTSFAVKANTLVLADVRGFHRRGDARPWTTRLALYANLRVEPFLPIA